MSKKRLILLGDSHCAGFGTEWPDLYKFIGPVPLEFNQHSWLRTIRQGQDNLPKLAQEFVQAMAPKIIGTPAEDEMTSIREKLSWGKLLADKIGVEYENISFDAISNKDLYRRIIKEPFWKGDPINMDLSNATILVGITEPSNILTYEAPPRSQQLKNVTLEQLALDIISIKNFIENRGGKMLYFHVDSYPTQLYNPATNPYYMEMIPYLVMQQSFTSKLTKAYQYRRFDGKHFDRGTQKMLADIMFKQLDHTDNLRIFTE